MGCPTALASGTLAANGEELVLEDDTGAQHPVVWPDGYRARLDGDVLVLVDRFGTVKARQGDHVDMGGGVSTDDLFHGCGDVTVRATASPYAGTQPSPINRTDPPPVARTRPSKASACEPNPISGTFRRKIHATSAGAVARHDRYRKGAAGGPWTIGPRRRTVPSARVTSRSSVSKRSEPSGSATPRERLPALSWSPNAMPG